MPVKLPTNWAIVLNFYKIDGLAGKGSFGQVCKAQHKTTGKIYAIKLIKDAFKSDYHARKTIREVTILRQLSAMKGNVFTTKLHDIIIPNLRK